MFRGKSVFKILSVVLAVLLLSVFFAGCGEYTPPANGNTGGTVVKPNPGDDDPPKPPSPPDDPDEDEFTVTLTHYDGTAFTYADYANITELKAQWTEVTIGRPAVYSADFNQNGVATAPEGLDGDYNVTLVLTDGFKSVYTYDPNPARPERRDELKATNYKKNVSVPLYVIKKLGAQEFMPIGGVRTGYYRLNETGAYSCTLTGRDDKQMFMYQPQKSGEYSFMTLMDVTADEINPIVDLHYGSFAYISSYPALIQDGGGAAGKYTKNVWMKYTITPDEVGNVMIFNLHSESIKPEAYPLTVYFIFERDGEFTKRNDYAEAQGVPVTEDFTKIPQKPSGTFTYCAKYRTTDNILNQKNVKLNSGEGGDGYYYYINPATGDFYRDTDGSVDAQYRVYAMLSKKNEVHDAFTYEKVMDMLPYVCEKAGKPAYNYVSFVKKYAAHCNGDGAYPVNEELKTFLQRWSVAQRYFNDGYNGYAEYSAKYNSDEDSQWMYACGLYV